MGNFEREKFQVCRKFGTRRQYRQAGRQAVSSGAFGHARSPQLHKFNVTVGQKWLKNTGLWCEEIGVVFLFFTCSSITNEIEF